MINHQRWQWGYKQKKKNLAEIWGKNVHDLPPNSGGGEKRRGGHCHSFRLSAFIFLPDSPTSSLSARPAPQHRHTRVQHSSPLHHTQIRLRCKLIRVSAVSFEPPHPHSKWLITLPFPSGYVTFIGLGDSKSHARGRRRNVIPLRSIHK